jgi:branched-subunit amino acid ABC-type transport system permease component
LSLVRYSVLVVGIVVATFAVAWGVAIRRADLATRWAAAFGAALAVANTLVAHALVLWSSRRSTNAFMGAVLGGMAGRMAFMLGAVVAAVLWLGLPKVPLAASLLSYFVLFLAMELTILHRRTSGAPHETREAQR